MESTISNPKTLGLDYHIHALLFLYTMPIRKGVVSISKKFKCSICGTIYDSDLRNQKQIYNTLIMECPKDRGICWPYEEKEFEELKESLLGKYTKEELWDILETMRANKALLEEKEFKVREGDVLDE